MKRNKLFLYTGLGILLLALIARWAELPSCCFWILLSAAILLKALFLLLTFMEHGFKLQRWFYLILAGVALILLAIPFKTIVPIPWVYKILFFSAIVLKTSGLVLLLFPQINKRKNATRHR